MGDIDERARERAMAQLIAVGRDGYSRFGRGVILVEAAHQRAVRYLARVAFEAELVERFGLTFDHDADTRRLAALLDTYDPDTQVQDLSVLRRIASEFGGRMALDCGVERGGRIAVGDPVELLEGRAED